jgi:argininosuccinate synthase
MRRFAADHMDPALVELQPNRPRHLRLAVVDRKSPHSLYSEKVVTFEDDAGAYDQRDAEGFIKLNALRLRLLGRRDGR